MILSVFVFTFSASIRPRAHGGASGHHHVKRLCAQSTGVPSMLDSISWMVSTMLLSSTHQLLPKMFWRLWKIR